MTVASGLFELFIGERESNIRHSLMITFDLIARMLGDEVVS
jgi:hypothetical protein